MIKYVKAVRRNLKDLTEPDVTYATSQSSGTIDKSALAKHMAQHGSSFSRGTIEAILDDTVDCIREMLLDGYIVNLGDLGSFNISLKSNGVQESVVDAETGEKPTFSASDITEVNCYFTPGEGFANMRADAEFEETITLKQIAEQKAANNVKIAAGTYLDTASSSDTGTGGSTQHD